MGRMRRVVLSVGAGVSLLAAGTVATVGAAGGFGEGTGHFTTNGANGNLSFFNPEDGSTQNLNVDRQMFMARPKGGGTPTAQQFTMVGFSVFVPSPDPAEPPLVDAFGCFVVPDSAFVISSDLQHASLNATVNAGDACPIIFPPPGDGSGKGGGPGYDGVTFPLTINATWTGNGVVSSSQDEGRFTCGAFRQTSQFTGRGALSSSATLSISGLGTFASGSNSFAQVNLFNVQLTVSGTGILSVECGGGGKGA